MILVVDSGDGEHPRYVYEHLIQRGERAVLFSTQYYPEYVGLSSQPHQPGRGCIKLPQLAEPFYIQDIQSAYCLYTPQFIRDSQSQVSDDPVEREAAKNEMQSGLGSFLRSIDCFWIDPVDTFEKHLYKTFQLQQIHQAGYRIPATLVTNNPEQVRAFYEAQQQQVIYKPCWFGAFTEKLQPEDLSAERLASLAKAPVCFQEYIPGVDVLVYLLYDEPFAVEMHADTLDFRQAGSTGIDFKPITLPAEIAQACIQLARLFGIHFAAIDMRRTPDGEYVFFEVNPNPVFRLFEQKTGYPITERLIKLLISPPGKP